MKTILLTGGNGYIGLYLSDYFSNEGFNIIKTSRVKNSLDTRCMELLDENSITGVCSDVDVVIHTANYDERRIVGNEKDALIANSFATAQLYLDAVNHGVSRFVYFSTFHVYGKSDGIVTEETDTSPINDYGITHLFAEQYLKYLSQKHNVPVDIIRLTNGIGTPLQNCDKWYLIVNDCCKNAVENKKIVLRSSGVQHRDFVAIKDVCEAVACLLSSPSKNKFNIYNVSSQKSVSMRYIAQSTAEKYKKITGSEVELIIPDVQPDETTVEIYVDSAKIRKLGWDSKLSVDDVIDEILRGLLS